MERSVVINVRISEDIRKKLAAEAELLSKKLGIKVTLSEYIRHIIHRRPSL